MRHISAQITDFRKLKAARNRTKMHQVSPNYREQLMTQPNPLWVWQNTGNKAKARVFFVVRAQIIHSYSVTLSVRNLTSVKNYQEKCNSIFGRHQGYK